jgi:hypothetical protein
MLAAVRFYFDLKEALSPQDIWRLCGGHPAKIEFLRNELDHLKGELGAMKLENQTSFIKEYVGLAAKMYSMQMVGHIDHHGKDSGDGVLVDYLKGKGTPTRVLQANATHDSYKQMIFNPTSTRVSFRTLRSKDHVVQQLEIDRKMLTSYNDKVFGFSILESRPLGHWRNRKAITADPTPTDLTTTTSSSSSSTSG